MDIYLITFIRLIVPLSIFFTPIIGVIVSQYVDLVDWRFTGQPQVLMGNNYQIWDKLLDTYIYTLALIPIFSWKDVLAKKIALMLYSLRFIGVVLFIFLKNGFWLVVFPNLFLSFFLFYLLFTKITGNSLLFTSYLKTGLILLSLVLPNLTLEYFLHILKRMPWQYLDIAKLLGINVFPTSIVNLYLYGFIYISLPILALIICIKKSKKLVLEP